MALTLDLFNDGQTELILPPSVSSISHAPTSELVYRDYQEVIADLTIQKINSGVKNLVIKAATGLGKTIIFCNVINRLRQKGHPALVLVRKTNLKDQAYEKFTHYFPHLWIEIEKAGETAAEGCDVIIGSVQTLTNRDRLTHLRESGPSVVVVDECHEFDNPTGIDVIGEFTKFGAPLIQFSATPLLKQRELMICDYGLLWGIENQWLKEPIMEWRHTNIDISNVKMSGGDYDEIELNKAIDKRIRTDIGVNWYGDNFRHLTGITRGSSIDNCDHWAEAYRAAGIKAEAISSRNSDKECIAILKRLRNRETMMVISNDKLVTGFDEDQIAALIHGTPTKSQIVFEQFSGRGLRKHPLYPKCFMLDLVDASSSLSLTGATLAGLPPGVDLRGASLIDAYKIFKEIEPTVRRLPVNRQITLTDLEDLVSENVDVLQQAETPADIAAVSKLPWLRMPSGWVCNCTATTQAIITCAKGGFVLEINKRGEVTTLAVRKKTIVEAVQVADQKLYKLVRGLKVAIEGEPAWKGELATMPQIVELSRIHYPLKTGMTKGEANSILVKFRKSPGLYYKMLREMKEAKR